MPIQSVTAPCDRTLKMSFHELCPKLTEVTNSIFDKEPSYIALTIPEGPAVNIADKSEYITYSTAYQAPGAYTEITGLGGRRGTTTGNMKALGCNGETTNFTVPVNEVDPGACSTPLCEVDFAQGFKLNGYSDFQFGYRTQEICPDTYAHIPSEQLRPYWSAYMANFLGHGRKTLASTLANLVVLRGQANMSIAGIKNPITRGGFHCPPKYDLSIYALLQYREHINMYGGLGADGLLHIEVDKEDWERAVFADQKHMYGANATYSFNPLTDDFTTKLGTQFHIYRQIKAVFTSETRKGYFKQVGMTPSGPRYEVIPINRTINVPGELGGVVQAPNPEYFQSHVTCDGIRYEVVKFIYHIHPESFRRYGLVRPTFSKPAGGTPPAGWNFEVSLIDGPYLQCNEANEKFALMARNRFRFQERRPELSGVIAYLAGNHCGYVNEICITDCEVPDKGFAIPKSYDECPASPCADQYCNECEGGKVATNTGACVPAVAGTYSFELDPCEAADVVFEDEPSTVNIKVYRRGDTASAASVDYTVSNGTATIGTHYTCTAPTGTLSWAAGEGGFKVIPITIISADPLVAVNFGIALSNPSGLPLVDCKTLAVNILSC